MFFCFSEYARLYHNDAIDFFHEQAVKTNNKDILYEIGNYYLSLDYWPQDYYSKAKYCYDRAAKFGSLKALKKLGDIYYYGYGVKKDYSKALYYYEKAYDSGNTNVCRQLGNIYRFGYGVERNIDKANKYYNDGSINQNSECILIMILFLLFFILILIIVIHFW